MSTRPSRRAQLLILTLAAALGACRTGRRAGPKQIKPAGELITARAIAHTDARNAWEVLQRDGHFSMDETANGDPARLASRRGRSSILLAGSDVPLVYVDGVQLLDLRMLREITAESIESIRILNGIEGTTYYGTNAGAGVIVIKTRAGPVQPPQG